LLNSKLGTFLSGPECLSAKDVIATVREKSGKNKNFFLGQGKVGEFFIAAAIILILPQLSQ